MRSATTRQCQTRDLSTTGKNLKQEEFRGGFVAVMICAVGNNALTIRVLETKVLASETQRKLLSEAVLQHPWLLHTAAWTNGLDHRLFSCP